MVLAYKEDTSWFTCVPHYVFWYYFLDAVEKYPIFSSGIQLEEIWVLTYKWLEGNLRPPITEASVNINSLNTVNNFDANATGENNVRNGKVQMKPVVDPPPPRHAPNWSIHETFQSNSTSSSDLEIWMIYNLSWSLLELIISKSTVLILISNALKDLVISKQYTYICMSSMLQIVMVWMQYYIFEVQYIQCNLKS